jgi:hypothetical protein
MNSFGSGRTKEEAEDEYPILADMSIPSIVRFLDEQIEYLERKKKINKSLPKGVQRVPVPLLAGIAWKYKKVIYTY